MSDYAPETTDDPRVPVAQILGDALIGLKSSVTVTSLSGQGAADMSALVHTEDGRAFLLTVRRDYYRDR